MIPAWAYICAGRALIAGPYLLGRLIGATVDRLVGPDELRHRRWPSTT